MFSFKIKEQVINPNLKVLTYENNLPQRGLPHFILRLNDLINCKKINTKVKLNSKNLIWWKFEPFRFLSVPHKNISKQIYHVVDPYMHFWQNKIQAKNADLIICTSPKYVSYFNDLNCKNVVRISHGISDEEFDIDTSTVNTIKGKYGDFIIMIGAIAKDIDIDLLQAIANEKINLVLIGSEPSNSNDWNELKKSEHVFYLGLMHAKNLKNYIAASKGCLIVYNFVSVQKGQVSRSPLKALNYMAQKKPIITTIDAEIESLRNEGIYQAKNTKEFMGLVKKAIRSELNVNVEKVDTYLNKHNYSKLIKDILERLNNAKKDL